MCLVSNLYNIRYNSSLQITDAITTATPTAQPLESVRFSSATSVSLLNRTIRMNVASLDYEQLIQSLQKFNEEIPASACAICFFQDRLSGNVADLVRHDSFCPRMSHRCLVCLEEGSCHRASECEYKLKWVYDKKWHFNLKCLNNSNCSHTVIASKFKAAADVCFRCLLYHGRIELHFGHQTTNCNQRYLKDRYQQVAWWFFRNMRKGSLAINFNIDAPTSPSAFFAWLYQRNQTNGMYNHLALVGMLYKFFDDQAIWFPSFF